MALQIEKQKELKQRTTMRTGGKAEFFAQPSSVEELQELLSWSYEHHHRVTVIGGGSNILISDRGISGLVLDTRNLRRITVRGTLLTARSGDPLEKAVSTAAEAGLSGLEYLSGLPGSVGGAVFGNAGSFNHAAADILAWVDYLDEKGSMHRLYRSQHPFSYRSSPFKEHPWILFEACFRLQPAQPLTVQEAGKGFRQRRRESGQYRNPSLGSIFKNPEQDHAGRLIEAAGLLGYSVGGAQVARYHGNYIINPDSRATSKDIYSLIQHIRQTIQEVHGVQLEPEIQLLGDFTP